MGMRDPDHFISGYLVCYHLYEASMHTQSIQPKNCMLQFWIMKQSKDMNIAFGGAQTCKTTLSRSCIFGLNMFWLKVGMNKKMIFALQMYDICFRTYALHS